MRKSRGLVCALGLAAEARGRHHAIVTKLLRLFAAACGRARGATYTKGLARSTYVALPVTGRAVILFSCTEASEPRPDQRVGAALGEARGQIGRASCRERV